MNYKMIANVIGRILCIEAVFILPACLISLYYGEMAVILPIVISALLTAAVGMLLLQPKPGQTPYYAREGFVAVALSWLMISVFGALPFYISGAIPSFLDSFFETVSGFTTTGASILTDVEALPRGLLYWRSFTHWLGGMGVLVFVLAVHPMSKGGGQSVYLLRAESPGPEVSKLVPKTHSSAKILYGMYIGLSVLQFVLLALGGMPWFDNITTVFGTAGTGGFAIRGDSMGGYSTYIQVVVTVFMTLFGVNFSVYYLLVMGKIKQALRNEELWLYLFIQAAATAVISFNIRSLFPTMGQTVQQAAFQVSSIMTTTGFATANFDLWPELSKWVILLLMFIGASAGSTGGGMKVSRVLLMAKAAKRERKRAVNPREVTVIRMDGRMVGDDTMQGIWMYLTYYLIIMLASMLVVSTNSYGVEVSLSAVVSCLNNIGPGFGICGPAGSFAEFNPLSKVVLCVDMLLGRLEIMPFLMLIAPAAWNKRGLNWRPFRTARR